MEPGYDAEEMKGDEMGKDTDKDKERIPSSQNLHAEWTEERKKQGLKEIPPINPKGTGTSTLARMDDSWNSVPNFFKQLIKDKRKE